MNSSASGSSLQHGCATAAEPTQQSIASSTQTHSLKVGANDSSPRGGDGGGGGETGTQLAGGGASAGRGPNAATSAHSRIRRRNRMITSCLECRRRKLKCDRLHPCSNCAKNKRDCLFLAPALDPSSRKKLTELKERMGSLERSLEEDVVDKKFFFQEDNQLNAEGRIDLHTLGGLFQNPTEGQPAVPEDEKDLKPTPLAVQDAAYEDGSDDDALDLGFKLGKLRMTDRVGGLFRPKIAEEVCASFLLRQAGLYIHTCVLLLGNPMLAGGPCNCDVWAYVPQLTWPLPRLRLPSGVYQLQTNPRLNQSPMLRASRNPFPCSMTPFSRRGHLTSRPTRTCFWEVGNESTRS